MSINYKQLQELVKEAMFTGGGINEPSAPEGIPHRMPAADTAGSEENMGDSKANKLYEMALAAREATEKLVEALDEPIYDSAYEDAFKASACMRRVLNSLEESGAHPMPDQRVVPPKATMQKYGSFVPPETHGAYFGNSAGLGMVEEEQDPSGAPEGALKGFGAGTATKSAQAMATRKKGQEIGSGKILQGVDNRERQILLQIEKILTQAADQVDLIKYRSVLQTFLTQFLRKIQKDAGAADVTKGTEETK
jgi:hypothetical protein